MYQQHHILKVILPPPKSVVQLSAFRKFFLKDQLSFHENEWMEGSIE